MTLFGNPACVLSPQIILVPGTKQTGRNSTQRSSISSLRKQSETGKLGVLQTIGFEKL
jgi:hypothetical protein